MNQAVTRRFSQRPSLLFICVGLLIPNALYLLAIVFGIGTPPRTAAIIAYVVVVLLAPHLPLFLVFSTYLVVLTYDVVNTVSLLFGLSVFDVVIALKFALEVKFFASPLYLVLIAALIATSCLSLWLLARVRHELKTAKLAPILMCLALLVVVDLSVNTSPYYLFGSAYGSIHEFESAVTASGFETEMQNPEGHNIIIVMVEGMGAFANPEHQKLLQEPFDDPALRKRYDLSMGKVHYFGSTTAAEMRELCHTREKYTTFFSARPNHCLPGFLDKAGYETTAIHGYVSRMFDRTKWYPNIGFQRMIFREELRKELPQICGGVFKGTCDSDIGDWIARLAKKSEPPQFLYWLTLNTHIPILPGEGRAHFNCSETGGPFGHAVVCNLTEMWLDVLDKVAAMATAADLPPTEILIVGDHAPPLWSRQGRRLFEPGKVTWFRLATKPDSVYSE
jgi:hypothetical protein